MRLTLKVAATKCFPGHLVVLFFPFPVGKDCPILPFPRMFHHIT